MIFGLTLVLSACVSIKQEPDRDSLAKTAQEYLRAHEYQKTLELYESAWNQNSNNTRLGHDYLQVIEYVGKNADRAFEKKDFPSAGYLYSLLLRYYPDNRMLVRSLSFSKDELNLSMKECSNRLNLQALGEYRKGNLKAAITIWKSILLFDIDNAEVKKALQTASTQLRNLEKNY